MHPHIHIHIRYYARHKYSTIHITLTLLHITYPLRGIYISNTLRITHPPIRIAHILLHASHIPYTNPSHPMHITHPIHITHPTNRHVAHTQYTSHTLYARRTHHTHIAHPSPYACVLRAAYCVLTAIHTACVHWYFATALTSSIAGRASGSTGAQHP